MQVIKLTHNDINEMVRHAVRSIVKESIDEVQGSIMAEKEDAIQEVVDYVVKEWQRIKADAQEPDQSGQYTYNDGKIQFKSSEKDYIVIVPHSIAKKLGVSDLFDINVAIKDYTVPNEYINCFGNDERGTEGLSHGGGEYNRFIRSTMKSKHSRIDLYVPSINGELQVNGFYTSLYHELNHTASRLSIQKKHQYLDDGELDNLHFLTASRRKNNPPHYEVMSRVTNGTSASFFDIGDIIDSKEVKEKKRVASFIFYSIWETTERNARAEEIYGELKFLNATRDNFRQIYPKTELYHKIESLKERLKEIESVPTDSYSMSSLWPFIGNLMNMKLRIRPRNGGIGYPSDKAYNQAVKDRFLKRSYELLDILYKKGMKVAELYFQRHEPQPQKSKLQQYKEKKKQKDDYRKAQNLLMAIFGKPQNREL